MDEKAAILRLQLDLVEKQLEASPGLRAEFERHSLMRDYFLLPPEEDGEDPVAEEIARLVTIKWADRDKPPHKGKPWTRRSDLFIRHVYRRWLDAGTLRHKHLRHDRELSSNYSTMISRYPDRDLGLPRENVLSGLSEAMLEKVERFRRVKDTLRNRRDPMRVRRPNSTV